MSWKKCKGQELIAEELKLVQAAGFQVKALGHSGVCLAEFRGGICDRELPPQPAGVPWQRPRLRGTICWGSAQPSGAAGTGYGSRSSPGPGTAAVPAAGDALGPGSATHGCAARGRCWGWHGHCGDRALELLSLPPAHGSTALAPILSGCDGCHELLSPGKAFPRGCPGSPAPTSGREQLELAAGWIFGGEVISYRMEGCTGE